jgi:hypothetical protein
MQPCVSCVSCNSPSQFVATLGTEHECYACGYRWQGLLALTPSAPELPAHELPAVVRELREEGARD